MHVVRTREFEAGRNTADGFGTLRGTLLASFPMIAGQG